MEKRLILAVALSLLILLSWSALISKVYHLENKEVTTKETPVEATPLSQPLPTTPVTEKLAQEPLCNFATGPYEIVFLEQLAAIKEVTFKEYQNYKLFLKNGFWIADSSLNFKKESQDQNSIVFVHSDPSKKITKCFNFHKANYTIDLEVKIQNLSSSPLRINLPLVLGTLNPSSNNVQARYQDITIATPAKNLHISPRKNSTFPEIKFLGLRDRYFCTIIEPGAGKHQGVIRKINPQEFEAGLGSPDLTIALGEQIGQNYLVYLGPQRLGLLNSAKTEWTNVIHYGTFDFISQILLQMLEFIHRLVRNWGLAIIALSILVYLILFPLTLKQIRSTKEMQALQPQVEALRKAYKDNPQRLNKEIMELYRQHKVNPLGGCLPLILQMPIFFALYQALMRSIALKGAKFLWIKDLSEPDKLFSLKLMGTKLDINILPILMIIGMLIQQRISAVATSASSAEQQKTMMIVMPVMFGIIFYGMPSGLVLYWFINSLLMLLFQLRTNRAK